MSKIVKLSDVQYTLVRGMIAINREIIADIGGESCDDDMAVMDELEKAFIDAK